MIVHNLLHQIDALCETHGVHQVMEKPVLVCLHERGSMADYKQYQVLEVFFSAEGLKLECLQKDG